MANFPSTPLLSYALEVEKITTSKKPNLILNVDGCIAVSFVDLLRHSGCFTKYELHLFGKMTLFITDALGMRLTSTSPPGP